MIGTYVIHPTACGYWNLAQRLPSGMFDYKGSYRTREEAEAHIPAEAEPA